MAQLVCLLVFVAVLVHSGLSLKCYDCYSDKVGPCLKSHSPKSMDCVASSGTPVCYYRHGLDANKHVHFNSSCGVIPANMKFEVNSLNKCKPDNLVNQVVNCKICNTDLCNTAPTSSINVAAILCLPVMYFITKFVLH